MRREFRIVPVDHTLRSSKGNLLYPAYTIRWHIKYVALANPELERRVVEGLRKAGLPE
jgi:hypothetical protein